MILSDRLKILRQARSVQSVHYWNSVVWLNREHQRIYSRPSEPMFMPGRLSDDFASQNVSVASPLRAGLFSHVWSEPIAVMYEFILLAVWLVFSPQSLMGVFGKNLQNYRGCELATEFRIHLESFHSSKDFFFNPPLHYLKLPMTTIWWNTEL